MDLSALWHGLSGRCGVDRGRLAGHMSTLELCPSLKHFYSMMDGHQLLEAEGAAETARRVLCEVSESENEEEPGLDSQAMEEDLLVGSQVQGLVPFLSLNVGLSVAPITI